MISDLDTKTQADETHAFPSALADQAGPIVSALAMGVMHPAVYTHKSVSIGGEQLHIPARVYYDTERLLTAATAPGDAGLIALCLGTRHHDGFVREQCLRRILTSDAPWLAPFVVQLLGEYVIEIIELILERFSQGIEAKYLDFYQHNLAYCEGVEQRATSYWAAYYRHRFATREEYPGLMALAALKQQYPRSKER